MSVMVATNESELLMVQSNEVYQEDKPHWGVKQGDRELSFCYFQIHAPAHQATADRLGLGDYRTNPESCLKMARVVYDDRGDFSAWTEYHKILALR